MKKPFLILWGLIGVFFIFFWVYLPSLSRYRDLKTKQEEIERHIRDLDGKIKTLKEERDLLKGDVSYLEKVIRDELGLVKPGEIVYRFVPDEVKKPADPAGAGEAEKKKSLPAENPPRAKDDSENKSAPAVSQAANQNPLRGAPPRAVLANAPAPPARLSPEPVYPRQETR